LSIAKELMTWADALPRVLVRIDEVLKLPDITDAQTAEIESIAELVGLHWIVPSAQTHRVRPENPPRMHPFEGLPLLGIATAPKFMELRASVSGCKPLNSPVPGTGIGQFLS